MEIIARLGRVLGWTGNGIAIIAVLLGLYGVVDRLWGNWFPEPAGFEITRTDGNRVYVVGPVHVLGSYSQAKQAAEKFRLDNKFSRWQGPWQVFLIGSPTGISNGYRDRSSAEKQPSTEPSEDYQNHNTDRACSWGAYDCNTGGGGERTARAEARLLPASSPTSG